MANLDYFDDIIFSRIKNSFSDTLKKKYPNLYFTTSDRALTEPKFPTVYISIQGVEEGQDLDGTTINAGLYTITVDVTDNENQTRAKEVLNEVKRIMKSMRFDVNQMPQFNNTDNTFRSVARFRRTVGTEDVL